MDAYRRKGILFDRIVSWEAERMPGVWSPPFGYPRDMHDRVTYHARPVTAEVHAPDNPLTQVARLARPRDYVVLKLDVDNPAIEVPLVLQLLSSRELINLVDEFFWEHHVYGSPSPSDARLAGAGSKHWLGGAYTTLGHGARRAE